MMAEHPPFSQPDETEVFDAFLGQASNTDRELWREVEGDYYANSLHITEGGGVGINVAGRVIVKPLADWHALAKSNGRPMTSREQLIGFVMLCVGALIVAVHTLWAGCP